MDKDLAHVHPLLRDLVPVIQARYAQAHPGCRLVIGETRRSVDEQAKRYARGSTKCDGVRSYSMHNYPVSYAVDLWVEAMGVVAWHLNAYDRLGAIVHDLAATHPIAWGGDFPGFYDGPHVQLTSRVLHRDLQRALNLAQPINATPLVEDGAWGPKSQAAVKRWRPQLDGRPSPALWASLAAAMDDDFLRRA